LAWLSKPPRRKKEKYIRKEDTDESLRNLIQLNDAGMLDCWILINAADQTIAQDYDGYRKEQRQLLQDYLGASSRTLT
jgi:hypothetical protein